MKYYFFLLLIFISVFGFSQRLKTDLKTIEKDLKNEKSAYNYEKLIFKYKAYPRSLDTMKPGIFTTEGIS